MERGGSVSRQRFTAATSAVHDVAVDLTGVTHSGEVTGRVLDAVVALSGVARVTLQGEVGPDVDLRLPDLAAASPAALDALLPRLGAVTVGYDFAHLREEPTVRSQFVRDVLADAALTDDERRKVLITGLRALELAEGMTVIVGANESAKSSWHVAIYAAVCGRRRGRGRGRTDKQRFADLHQPWDSDAWLVSLQLDLDNGRRIEMWHDLAGRVDCHEDPDGLRRVSQACRLDWLGNSRGRRNTLTRSAAD